MNRQIPILALVAAASPPSAVAQPLRGTPAVAAQPAPPVATYGDLADLGLVAPVAAHVRLRRAQALSGPDAAGVPAGFTRFYVEADILALIRGNPASPTRISYLVDLPNGADGRPARPARRSEWIIFARPVEDHVDQLQLVRRDGQLPHSPELADRVRAVLREITAADAPPAITGIGRAFHTPGPLPETGETQIFLQTAEQRPISVTISRAQGSLPRWFVSTSEFVDAGATQPREGTLLWYRLACVLPAQLPAASLADAGEYRARIVADYRFFRDGLGPCPRLLRGGA